MKPKVLIPQNIYIINPTNIINRISRIYPIMSTKQKSVTIECSLCEKIEEHNEKNGSNFSPVINMALKDIFINSKKS